MRTSIVVTSRNDGYGGHLELRAEQALNTMAMYYDEVIYVDWCSPEESLIKALNIKPKGKIRSITVRPDDLRRLGLEHLLAIPMVEVLGRNIGIRRARGQFIASSNIDILPGPVPMGLWYKNLYTVRRRNVPVPFFTHYASPEYVLYDACRVHKDSFPLAPLRDDGVSLIACCGDFQLAHRLLWDKMRGFEEAMVYRDAADSNLMKKGSIYGEKPLILDLDIFHLDHSGHGEGSGGVSIKNDWDTFITNFLITQNSMNWGFADYDFEEEII